MVDIKYDKVLQVDIGRTAADFCSITNPVYFAEKVVSPDGDLVDPLSMINGWNPGGVHQNHKYWELTLCLDTNYYPDDANPEQYWAYYQNVDLADTLPAIVEDGANPDIEWFVVHVRQHDGTYEKFTYSALDTNVLWCVGETSEFSNETGERHQTVAFKFICLQERVREDDVVPVPEGAPQGVGKVKRINNVRTGGVDSVNILGCKEDFVMVNTPQFVPNTYQGVGLKQDEKYRVLTVTVDSETDIFDSMMNITAAQAAAGTDFLVDFTMDDTAGTVETWTYEHAKTYMSKREEGRINEAKGRETIEYTFISYGTKSITQA